MRTHVGDTLVVRRTSRAGDAPTGTTEIPRDDGKIDTGCRYLGRISIIVVTGSGQLVVGSGLVDHRCRVLRVRRWASTTGCVENRSLPNQISGDAGDRDDMFGVVRAEAGAERGNPRIVLGLGPCEPQVENRPCDPIEKDGGGSRIRFQVDRRSPTERVIVVANDDVFGFAVNLRMVEPVRRDRRGLPN